jgi:hypothetical protein
MIKEPAEFETGGFLKQQHNSDFHVKLVLPFLQRAALALLAERQLQLALQDIME